MRASPAGISGTLFPSRYLADGLPDVAMVSSEFELDRRRRRLERWWSRVVERCGPATGIRAIFDVVAMPLFAILGYQATKVEFEGQIARVRLQTPDARPVALMVTSWASHPSSLWRDATTFAMSVSTHWCFVIAPPFLSLVDVRGHVSRRHIDFRFPDVIDRQGVSTFLTLVDGAGFHERVNRLIGTATGFQDRVRADLQKGVRHSLETLIRALTHPSRRPSDVSPYDESLTLIYRVLFLLFVESRELVPHRHPIYRSSYTIASLAREALRGPDARGLWDALAAITRLSRRGCRADDLIVRPFNGRLFAKASAPTLEGSSGSRRIVRSAERRDAALREALVALATRAGRGGREEISYSDLGVEQLGAVYERVLELGHGLSRKQSGTFYTPQPLTEFVVRRTLGPLTAGASADAILALRVVDPAMGSGAFLVAACRHLAAAYERALIDDGRATATDIDDGERANIRRLVAERCLAGVDVNPIAVQLARLSLWLATLAKDKPLTFLDHRLRVGNSLVGITPDDLRTTPSRRAAQRMTLPFGEDHDIHVTLRDLSRSLASMNARRDDTVEDVRTKETAWNAIAGARSGLTGLGRLRLACSLWCARWFWRDATPPSNAEIRAAIDALIRGDATLRSSQLARWLTDTRALEDAHRFFHWPVEFADVYYDDAGQPRTRAGFDAVIGNPPWEMLRHDHGRNDQSSRQPSLVRFVRESGLYPSCDRGHVNLYQPFLERSLSLARRGGRVGLVLPWGLASDDGAAALRTLLLDRAATDTIVGLDNGRALFPIHRGLRFLVVVASPGGPRREIQARFGVRTPDELDRLRDDVECPTYVESSYPVRLTPERLERLTGPTRRIPDVRRPRDLDLLERLSDRFPRLGDSDGWNARFGRELNVTDDRRAFGRRGLPVIEGKHVMPFSVAAEAAHFHIDRDIAAQLLPTRPFEVPRLAYRDVSGVANRVSLIAAIVPANVVTTHTLFCLRNAVSIEQQHFLCALFNSYALNAIARMLMGGHLTTSLVEGLPVPAWTNSPAQRRIARLAVTLSRRHDSSRVAAALHAAVARLYGLDDKSFAHILEGFPLVPAENRALARALFLQSSQAPSLQASTPREL